MENKKIALYGLGKKTKAILEQYRNYNIVALLDRNRTGEIEWNLPIVSVKEAQQMGVTAIIIAASSVNTPVIFRRIADECEQYHISVYDMTGRKMEKKTGPFVLDSFYETCTEARLRELIWKSDVISFDIFDTLLVRDVLFPTDIFEIVAEESKEVLPGEINFAKYRIQCEREKNLVGEPKFSDIYGELMIKTGLSQDMINMLMTKEIEEEKHRLHAREKMLSVAREANAAGKIICCTSDMYLSKDILSDILVREGYDFLNQIFISCEYGNSKADGLYSIVREVYPTAKILHIGDNLDADIVAANKFGMDATFQIPSIYQMIGDSSAYGILDREMSLEERIHYGTLFAKKFNDPFLFERTKGIYECQK